MWRKKLWKKDCNGQWTLLIHRINTSKIDCAGGQRNLKFVIKIQPPPDSGYTIYIKKEKKIPRDTYRTWTLKWHSHTNLLRIWMNHSTWCWLKFRDYLVIITNSLIIIRPILTRVHSAFTDSRHTTSTIIRASSHSEYPSSPTTFPVTFQIRFRRPSYDSPPPPPHRRPPTRTMKRAASASSIPSCSRWFSPTWMWPIVAVVLRFVVYGATRATRRACGKESKRSFISKRQRRASFSRSWNAEYVKFRFSAWSERLH